MQNIYLVLATVLFFSVECCAVLSLSVVCIYVLDISFGQGQKMLSFNNSAFPVHVSGNLIHDSCNLTVQ